MKRLITAVVFFAALLVAWQLVYNARIWSPVLVPSPKSVALYLWENTFKPGDGAGGANPNRWQLFFAVGITLKRLLAGYFIGLAAGIPLGMITARFRPMRDTLGVLALGLQGLPSVCWVPLALLWYGQTEAAMLFVVVMGTVWSVVLATEAGVRNVNPIFVRAARTMGSRWLHVWVKVIIPASLPFIVSGMKQGWAFAWRSLMAAEIFVSILTGFGLGQ
jgi:NitT/TauT family transport system permease protein